MLISISANVEKFLGHFCAGDGLTFNQNGRNFTPDSCNGDSGGPLTYKDPFTDRFQLVGIGISKFKLYRFSNDFNTSLYFSFMGIQAVWHY